MRAILITIILTTLIFPQQSKLSSVVNYLSAIIPLDYLGELLVMLKAALKEYKN